MRTRTGITALLALLSLTGGAMTSTGVASASTAGSVAGADARPGNWLPATPAYWPLVVGQQATRPQEVTSGVAWNKQTYQSVGGAQIANVMNVDLGNPNVRLGVVQAGDVLTNPADETISSMAN